MRVKDIGSDEQIDRIGNWPVGKMGLVIVLLVLVVGGVGSACAIAGGWFGEAQRQVSVTNVKEQWQFAYDYKTSMEAVGQQWCSIKGAENAETDPALHSQRVSQRIAVEQNYARVASQYNAGVENAFKAKYIKPGDVPQFAPALTDQITAFCPTLAP